MVQPLSIYFRYGLSTPRICAQAQQSPSGTPRVIRDMKRPYQHMTVPRNTSPRSSNTRNTVSFREFKRIEQNKKAYRNIGEIKGYAGGFFPTTRVHRLFISINIGIKKTRDIDTQSCPPKEVPE
jgi:hypothetical protein